MSAESAAPRLLPVDELNRLSREEFVQAVRPLFETAEPLADALLADRPYRSYEELLERAATALAMLPEERKIEVLNAHPRIGDSVDSVRRTSALSYREQGYDRESALDPEDLARVYRELAELNRAYEERFGFRFVVFVDRRPKAALLPVLRERLGRTRAEEMETGLREMLAIARDRLRQLSVDRGLLVRASIRYGKGQVSFYRTYARPLAGLEPIPESAFTGRPNVLFGAEVDVEVFGDNFLPAYTEGDNSGVVPTDTMKNFVHEMALGFEGATLEGFLYFLGRRFLETYRQMQSLRLTGREAPFTAARVPTAEGGAFADSSVLFSRSHDDRAFAQLVLVRDGTGASIAAHRCGREGMQLIKVTGSSFMHFARDAYTTLPEQADRPLFIYLDVYWRYADPADAVAEEPARYVPAEQVRDCVTVVFHQFVSRSIQHLVHEMGQRLLQRFPRLAEVSFQAQNRLWDTAAVSEADPKTRVYTDPRPPYGTIGLTLTRA